MKLTNKPTHMSPAPLQEHPSRSIQHLHTQKWYAWISLSKGQPRILSLEGEIEGNNVGIEAVLLKKKSMEDDDDTLKLELVIHQRPGTWKKLSCWNRAKYDEVLLGNLYSMVYIYVEGSLIEKFPVELLAG
ncbi:MAG: hypothetical protein IPL46_19920 [Saprospiraceae bacterium]|nr:hypothetical protein [Saprospiraceae bacterium]